MKKLLSLLKGRWLQEDVLSRLFGNAGILLAGTLAASLFGLASNVLAARGLGPDQYGFLVLLSTYAFFVVYGLVSFQSWQALIHYGAQALESRNIHDFKSLIKFGFILDGASALIGAAVAAAGVYAFGRWKNWNPAVITVSVLYGLGILFRLTGAPTAILRLLDRFDLLAFQQVAAAALRLIGILVVYMKRAGLASFLYIWLATEVAGYLILFLLGWTELHRRGMTNVLRSRVRGISKKFPGIFEFFLITNVHSTLRMGVREFDIMVVGGLLGTSAAGIYKIVRQFARVLGRIDEPMRQAIYPDLSKNWARRDAHRFRKLLWNPALVIGTLGVTVWLGFLFLGRPVLRLTVGSGYVNSYIPILVYLAGVVISMATFHFQSTLLAMGQPGQVFQVTAWSTIVYFLLLFWLTSKLNILGAALSFVAFQLIWSSWMAIKIWDRLHRFEKSEVRPGEKAPHEDFLSGIGE